MGSGYGLLIGAAVLVVTVTAFVIIGDPEPARVKQDKAACEARGATFLVHTTRVGKGEQREYLCLKNDSFIVLQRKEVLP